ncbi:helix-turn-helix transcriptional regulator [Clostridium sp. YIM B02555]|uniref:helix-turn-helix domain-containing protein n=1 Tax=Clostridium sp. YIM B02555 TaxID=2911968 RepID=UPI001EEF4209|nr:helix-turn-helix transcriptional regulator [Clostridium sp. YIM B02555]
MNETELKIAGKALKKLRKETKLSIFKVAKKVHISMNYLSLLKRGLNIPSDTVLFNLA